MQEQNTTSIVTSVRMDKSDHDYLKTNNISLSRVIKDAVARIRMQDTTSWEQDMEILKRELLQLKEETKIFLNSFKPKK